MMLGLLGLMAIDDTRPLSLVVPSATGLGPIGVHTVPLRLMSGPPSSLGPHPPAWLPGPASHRLAALLPTQATEATAGGHWRKPPAWPGRLPPDGDRESVGGRRAPGPFAGGAAVPHIRGVRVLPFRVLRDPGLDFWA